jgi:DnaJ-class molecular chaperone
MGKLQIGNKTHYIPINQDDRTDQPQQNEAGVIPPSDILVTGSDAATTGTASRIRTDMQWPIQVNQQYCPTCSGSGRVISYEGPTAEYAACPTCRGTGTLPWKEEGDDTPDIPKLSKPPKKGKEP